ncbi:hypothetical protein PMAYCL1PPCAC_24381 [Pristionchus mayeri]|uniref:Saposin B-type domain-containing protein n=1 Tax=Pristionchus mayeri TaxID=1317129 RepID=A0AAN5CZT0_9BILA|nr:hypothetical protein PMAYCL1PPCAC_24381 [Pristionchus mayeri]
MLKLFFIIVLLLPLSSSAPTNQLPGDLFCKSCVTIVKRRITSDDFIDKDKAFFEEICKKFLGTGPMSSVCAAGLLGEIDYLHDKYKGNEQALCVELGCPEKKN